MPDLVQDIKDFHEKFKLNYDGKPQLYNPEMQQFRMGFLQEELNEYRDATIAANAILINPNYEQSNSDFIKLQADRLDALVDLVYVALGDAYLQGFDFNEAWRRVHEKNMAKVRAATVNDSERGTTYDVVKPEGWTPPDHTDLVSDHAHQDVIKDVA